MISGIEKVKKLTIQHKINNCFWPIQRPVSVHELELKSMPDQYVLYILDNISYPTDSLILNLQIIDHSFFLELL